MLLFLLACHLQPISDCVRVDQEVGDDDSLGDLDVTVGDLVSELSGVRTFPAAVEAGLTIAAQLTTARADAPAVFSDATWETRRELRPGIGVYDDLMFVVCEDTVTVPFEAELTTADDSVALAGEVDAVSQMWSDTTEGVGGVDLEGTFDADGTLDPEASGGSFIAFFDGPDLFRVDVSRRDDLLLTFPPEEEK